MNLQRCSRGHFYNKDQYDECPYCRDIVETDAESPRKGIPESYSGKAPFLFISYAHKDTEVMDILKAFRDNSIRFWYDEGIKTGAKWMAEIAERISNCTVFFVFISQAAILSENVKNEMHLASVKQKRIILIHLDDAELDDELELQYGRLQHVFRHKYPVFDDFIIKLLNTVDTRTIDVQEDADTAGREMLKRYKILSEKKSGYSANYCAQDLKTDALVFIKHISFNDSYLGKIRSAVVKNETVFLKLLHQCPFCNHLVDYFEDSNNVYIVRNYIEGQSLQEVINRLGRLELDDAMQIAAEAAETLCYFYNMTPRIIHNDIKPANIIVPRFGHTYMVDFGISRLSGDSGIPAAYREMESPMGTVGYAAPELYKGTSDVRTDIYALGVTLFQMLTGIQNLCSVSDYDVRLYVPEIPAVVADIILKATAKDPADRYQMPVEMMYDLYHYRDIGKMFHTFADLSSQETPPIQAEIPQLSEDTGTTSLLYEKTGYLSVPLNEPCGIFTDEWE